MGRKLNRREWAELRGYSTTQATDDLHAGLPHQRRGRVIEIDSAEAILWCMERARQNLGIVSVENARLKRAQAERIELEIRESTGGLVSIEDARLVVDETLAILTAGLDALGPRLAPQLTKVWDAGKIQRIVRAETQALRKAATDRLARLADLGERGGDIPAATRPNAGRVGKR